MKDKLTKLEFETLKAIANACGEDRSIMVKKMEGSIWIMDEEEHFLAIIYDMEDKFKALEEMEADCEDNNYFYMDEITERYNKK